MISMQEAFHGMKAFQVLLWQKDFRSGSIWAIYESLEKSGYLAV